MSNINNPPKRSHSLAHHKRHDKLNLIIESPQQLLQQQPSLSSLSIPTTPQRSTSIGHQQVRLARSSSLSHHHHKKMPIRSKSLPQKPIAEAQLSPLPPIPSPSPPSYSFLFLQHEPPKPQQQYIKSPKRSSSLKKNSNKSNYKKKSSLLLVKTSSEEDEEVTKALLEWKHKSVFKVDWANMFSPTVELWKMNDNIFGSVEDLLSYKSKDGNEEVENAANSLWEEEEDFAPKKEIASYLGKLNPFNHRVLKHYMDYFDFTNLKLDEAFRKLCSKLYFKAEAQEIDRILEVFSHKYWSINKLKYGIYKNADVVYTITYSIMLLNTDLHLVQISSHAKMTCALFCENTMSTVLEQKISLVDDEELADWKQQLKENLKDIYASVKNNGILQPVTTTYDEPKSFLKRMGSLTQRKKRSASLSSSLSSQSQ